MSQDPALEPPPAYVQANPALENLPDSAQRPSLLKYDIQKEVQETLESLGDLKENMAIVLRDYDTIVVLDDSGSMNTRDRWPAVRASQSTKHSSLHIVRLFLCRPAESSEC